MRAVNVAFLSGLALAAVAVQAAPNSPVKAPAAELRAEPPIELVNNGCGHGWHRPRWRDHWGYWHWGHCVPNGGPHDDLGAGWN
jgi:hypothetical protein